MRDYLNKKNIIFLAHHLSFFPSLCLFFRRYVIDSLIFL